ESPSSPHDARNSSGIERSKARRRITTDLRGGGGDERASRVGASSMRRPTGLTCAVAIAHTDAAAPTCGARRDRTVRVDVSGAPPTVGSSAMRLVVARCTVDYDGRLTAHLPEAVRLIMVKADGCVAIHADGGAYKPLNWMN